MQLDKEIPVIALNLQGNIVGQYDNLHQADNSLFLGKKCSNIWYNVVGRTLRCGKYHFVPVANYNPNHNYSYKFRIALRKFKKNGK